MWSKYNYLFKSEKYGCLLFNSLSDSFMALSVEVYDFIMKNNDKPEILKQSEIGDVLEKNKCLVKSEYDEINQINYLETLSRTNRIDLNLTIAPTYACNFACTYCYEEDRRNVFLDDSQVESIIKFVDTFKDVKELYITWYGGEPLMGIDTIEKLTKKIEPLGKKIKHHIVTNGYLLNKKNIEILDKLNIKTAQITLDGPKEIHDKRRPLLNGKGTFDQILKNIDLLFEMIPDFGVSFRVNIDKTNNTCFKEIYNLLHIRYKGKRFNVYAGFVDEILACKSVNSCVFNRNDMYNFKKEMFINHKIDLGLYPSYKRQSCMAQMLNGYVIGADGNIFKCWNDIGIDEKAISNVKNPKITNPTLLFRYLNSANNIYDPKCKDCFFLPMCDGGCQYVKMANFFKEADIDNCHLAKGNLKESLEIYYGYKLEQQNINQS